MRSCSKVLLATFFALCTATPVWAQWTTQTIQLRPGFNAVFVEVEPEDNRCDAMMAGLPVESVWRWNRRFNSVQFISDPNQLIREPEAWLVWFSAAQPIAGKSGLHTMEGGRAYLIRSTNATAINWTIKGRPVRRNVEWLGDGLNFAGFHLSPSNSGTFQSFFGGAAPLTNASLYRLNTAGIWALVSQGTAMQRGEALWIKPQGLPTFQGPLELQLKESGGLNFGTLLSELSFAIHNPSTTTRSITVRQMASENPPTNATVGLAGAVALSYWQNEFAVNRAGFTNLPAQLSSNIPPGGTWELRLAIRRTDLSPYTPPVGVPNSVYQSVLEVSESAGNFRQLIPVTAEASSPVAAASAARFGLNAQGSDPDPKAGLWIGQASINKVSQPASGTPSTPVATSSEFSFRLLVHVDASGQARLLQKVLQMWAPGTYKPANDGTTNLVIDQPGRFVLLTDESQGSQYTGAAVRDGQSVARRFSSAAFAFRKPLLMVGSGPFGMAASQFSCVATNDYRDPVNPFVHTYHSDHNNLDDRYTSVLPEGKESYTVNRAVQLEFSGQDPDNLALPGWGDNRLGGSYRETITGLHKAPLYLEGSFTLHRASTTTELN
jgi:hypothetical protein